MPAPADIDGDGWSDLVVGLETDEPGLPSRLGVALNDHLGGHRAVIEAPFDCYPRSVAFGDVNGDGRTDVGLSCGSAAAGEAAVVALAQPDGSLSSPQVIVPGDADSFGRLVAMGDLNGDGRVDLVVADEVASTDEAGYVLQRFLGTRQGAFGTPQTTKVRSEGLTFRMSIRDLDGDGNGDVLIEGNSETMVVPALASGALGNGRAYALTYPVETADIDGDGRIDLVGYGRSNGLEVLLGRSSGFAAGGSYQMCRWGSGLAVGDLNGDGRPDVACNEDHLRVYPNLGSMRFGTPVELAGSGSASAITDWDHDGDADLVADGGAVVFFNEAGMLPKLSGVARWPEGTWIRKGDLNGDGMTDAVASDTLGTRIHLGRADGTWNSAASELEVASFGAPAFGDLNGDGRPDLAFSYREPAGRIGVTTNDGTGRFGAQIFYATGPYPSSAEASDLNGDGKHDLVVQIAGGVSVLLNDGQGRFPASADYNLGDVRAMAVADLGRDGAPEIVAIGPVGAFVLRNDGRGTFSPEAQWFPGALTLALVDLDGDGRPELAAGGPELTVYRNQGDGRFGPTLPMGGRATDLRAHQVPSLDVMAGDLNGDGHADLVAVQGDSGTVAEVRTYFGDGKGNLWRGDVYALSPKLSDLAFGDLNSDGRPDLISLTR